uniref:CBM6 domain-containing protein n=1 Tax=Grammatophora oceanica TaxID=210454 RepID=A0A7S1Y6D0_9STRA|mmetsp:Transcript_2636/g.3603  ORF Transcript_2636/g.3603 Transcript_2636/m.3603 type:complete len:693 (+) Transcript_2636:64-2142(+)
MQSPSWSPNTTSSNKEKTKKKRRDESCSSTTLATDPHFGSSFFPGVGDTAHSSYYSYNSGEERLQEQQEQQEYPIPVVVDVQEKKKRKMMRIAAILCIAITFLCGAATAGIAATRRRTAVTPPPPLPTNLTVGAYYYPWHGPDFHRRSGYLRRELDPPQVPQLGEYDDTKPAVIAKHLEWSRQANIGLWVCSWWGPGRREDETTRTKILPHNKLFDHKIALFWETRGRLKPVEKGEKTIEEVVDADISYLCQEYFGHDNYYRIRGRPVLFVYLSRWLEDKDMLEEVATAMRTSTSKHCNEELYIVGDHAFHAPKPRELDLLDAITNYDAYGPIAADGGTPYATKRDVNNYYDDQDGWQVMASQHSCDFIPCASPGFNDRGVRLEVNHPPLSRKLNGEGNAYGTFFNASLARAVYQVEKATGNLLMINSFNEWHEDTQIEPVKVTTEPTNGNNAMTQGVMYEGYGDLYLQLLYNWTADEETPMPSMAPTASPTASPTMAPTKSPTMAPSSPQPSQSQMPSFEKLRDAIPEEPTVSPTEEPDPLSPLFTLPFTAAALEYTAYLELDDGDPGGCTDGNVDAWPLNGAATKEFCQSECTIGWTTKGEYVEYDFETTDAMKVRVTARVASKQVKTFRMVLDGKGWREMETSGKGWGSYEEQIWYGANISSGGTHTLRVEFTEGGINLCSISIQQQTD